MTDPTDPGGVTGGQRRPGRSASRAGESGSPVGSPLTIVLAVIAIAAAFLIFRSISDSDASGGQVPGVGTDPAGGVTTVASATTPDGGSVAPTAAPTTTGAAPEPVTEGATVLVANASGMGGSAGAMSTELETAGYTMAEPTDDNSDEPVAETVVYFVVGNETEAVAQSVARALGNADVLPMPDPIPTADGNLGTATVLVLLGEDAAGQTLEDLAVPAAPASPTPAGAATDTTEG